MVAPGDAVASWGTSGTVVAPTAEPAAAPPQEGPAMVPCPNCGTQVPEGFRVFVEQSLLYTDALIAYYSGDFETMGRVERLHWDTALRLKTKKIVMGECGHAFRSVYDVGNRWLGWKIFSFVKGVMRSVLSREPIFWANTDAMLS